MSANDGDVRTAVMVHPRLGEPGLLGEFNAAGLITSTDIQVASRLGKLTGENRPEVLLAVALAVRALRGGSVCVRLGDPDELATLAGPDDAGSASGEPSAPPPWPGAWLNLVESSPLVAAGVDPDGKPTPARPMRLVDGRLYLDRYWRDELTVRRHADARLTGSNLSCADPAQTLARLFPESGDGQQRLAAAHAVRRRLTVLTGGPGTGKTTTVARVLAVLQDLAGPLRVALAAPTGKAAARLQEAVQQEVRKMSPADQQRMGTVKASTVHRLLGYRGSSTRFRHDAHHQLIYDVVVIDETSMVPLSMMARLLEALRPDTRLVLVGDPDQLASVEAGAVLGDLVARPPVTVASAELDAPPDEQAALANGVVRLHTVHRHDAESAIIPLAAAIRSGAADAVVQVLRTGAGGVELVEAEPDHLDEVTMAAVRTDAVGAGEQVLAAAQAGDAEAALSALGAHRLMVAHRRGPAGVAHWAGHVEAWIAAAGATGAVSRSPWQVGRPILVTANDPSVGLYNGDTGVLIADGDAVVAAFGDPMSPMVVRTHRLPPVETVHAMTVHRAQGSQFDRVSLILPPADSPLLTRELFYTAVTRAQKFVRVVGTVAAVRAAVAHPVRRASGLRDPLEHRHLN